MASLNSELWDNFLLNHKQQHKLITTILIAWHSGPVLTRPYKKVGNCYEITKRCFYYLPFV